MWTTIRSDPFLFWNAALLAILQIRDFLVGWIGTGAWRATDPSTQIFAPYGRIAVVHLTILVAAVPVEVFFFSGVAFLAYLFLRFTKWGHYVYLMGDNFLAARNMGIPVRPMTVLRYVISALIAFSAGVLTASSLHSINVRVVNSNPLYDIILVVVIGGVGLSGGKGGMRNVIVGALLIGIMQNAMTILDISNIYQNLIKSTILLVAIVVDSLVNPRDEQTAQQGDI